MDSNPNARRRVPRGVRPVRMFSLAVLLLPALLSMRVGSGAIPIASFTYGCPDSGPAPRVRVLAWQRDRAAKPRKSSQVSVMREGIPASRPYEVIGEVRAISRSAHTAQEELVAAVQRTAGRMAGDAVIALEYEDAAKVTPREGAPGALCLTCKVVRWL